MNKDNLEKIDIVITWVDDQDKKWQSEKRKYENNLESSESNHSARFRSWDNLKYLLRSIEKYMPWVNQIFLVTCGQVPKWLVSGHDKLKLVFHEEFIPKKYLPTFSSHTIELNLFRIPELSEKFVYFNDDIFLLNNVAPKDFFYNDLPCDNAILHVHCPKKSLIIHTIANNDVAVVNDYFDIHESINEKKSNWFNIKYGFKNNLQNLIFARCPRFPGFRQYHMVNSFLKSTFSEVWEKEEELLDSVCMNKFRVKTDVNQWVMRNWQLASNRFYPYPKYKIGKMIDFEKGDAMKVLSECVNDVLNSKFKMICINDGDKIENFEKIRDEVNRVLEEKFPEKSSFEK